VACETGEGAERLKCQKVERLDGYPHHLIPVLPVKVKSPRRSFHVVRADRWTLLWLPLGLCPTLLLIVALAEALWSE
jgi:hypothetical protein